MIIQLDKDLSSESGAKVINTLNKEGYAVTEVKTQIGRYLIAISKQKTDIRKIGSLPGVIDVHVVSDSYKLVSSKWKLKRTVVKVDDVLIGGSDFTVMAGPCAIENEAQVEAIAQHLVASNIKIMRGGIFKPRSSPYSFQGVGETGLKMFSAVCKAYGLKIISEVMESAQIDVMYDYVDIFQVGARNSQNFNLLHALGKTDKPVLLKRGISGSIDELLQSAEYIFSSGNEKLVLCERGIRTFENASRNTFDINAIPILKEKSHLPVIADPSHGIGVREHVPAIALAAMAAGADGVIYEVHEKPEEAYSDGQQTLDFSESSKLMHAISGLKPYVKQLQAH
jgi:3-deoxy-7-phosphoheptulonate synthase